MKNNFDIWLDKCTMLLIFMVDCMKTITLDLPSAMLVYAITSTNPCTHGKAILIVKEMSALIIVVFCKYNLIYAFQ